MKSFRPRDGSGEPPAPGRNGERDFKGEKRSNETHASTSDADARLFRKGDGEASRLCFIGHVLMENRNGLAVGGVLTRAAGTAEASAARHLTQGLPPGPRTLGADKGYDSRDLVMELRELGVTPHVAQIYCNCTAVLSEIRILRSLSFRIILYVSRYGMFRMIGENPSSLGKLISLRSLPVAHKIGNL